VFESIQVIRDRDVDSALGLRTTAVSLGVPRTLRLGRALALLAALYAALVLHPASGAVAASALLVPWRDGEAASYWTAVKLVFGLAWLAACASVYLDGASSGLLLRLEAQAAMGGT
jgi:4-hydroxybenzoate polyprenyltransferase